MKLLMHLRGVLTGFLLLGLMSCGAEPDFENRYAADAGDILRAETLAEDTVPEMETEPEDTVILPVAEVEPETIPTVVEAETVSMLTAAETETETLPTVAETETETLPTAMETEQETLPTVAETETETLPTVAETETEILPTVAETEPETLPTVAETEPETMPTATAAEPESPADIPDPIPDGVTFVCNTNSGKYHLPDCGSVAKIKAENIAYLTCGESEIPAGFAPCSVCLAASAALLKAQIPAADPGTVSYILNTNTMKFHAPICKSVNKIKAENYAKFSGTRDEAIASGYSPCGNCKP